MYPLIKLKLNSVMVLEIKLFAFALAFNYMLTHKMTYKSSPVEILLKTFMRAFMLCKKYL